MVGSGWSGYGWLNDVPGQLQLSTTDEPTPRLNPTLQISRRLTAKMTDTERYTTRENKTSDTDGSIWIALGRRKWGAQWMRSRNLTKSELVRAKKVLGSDCMVGFSTTLAWQDLAYWAVGWLLPKNATQNHSHRYQITLSLVHQSIPGKPVLLEGKKSSVGAQDSWNSSKYFGQVYDNLPLHTPFKFVQCVGHIYSALSGHRVHSAISSARL